MIWFLYLNLLFINRRLKILSALHAHTQHSFSKTLVHYKTRLLSKTLLHTSILLFSFLSLYYLSPLRAHLYISPARIQLANGYTWPLRANGYRDPPRVR